MNDDDTNEGDWVFGPSLPGTALASTLVEYDSSVVLIGGSSEDDEDNSGHNLYQLVAPNKSWKKMNQTMKMKRSWHVSFLVPDDLTEYDLCHIERRDFDRDK